MSKTDTGLKCTKAAFDTKLKATVRMNEINSAVGNKVLQRAYKCSHCSLYHLTSWTNKKKAYIKKEITLHKERKIQQLKEAIAKTEEQYWAKRKNWK